MAGGCGSSGTVQPSNQNTLSSTPQYYPKKKKDEFSAYILHQFKDNIINTLTYNK
jgi:hypothetical protein